MNRRGNNEGTITKRADGRWMARVSLPDGRRKCVYGKTRQEVAQGMTAILRDRAQGMPVTDERLTVAAFLDEWLAVAVKSSVRPRTYNGYATHVERHIKPAIGKVPLAHLTPEQVQRMLNAQLGSGLSPNSMLWIRATLRRALNQAVKWGRVPRNVATLIDPPKARRYRVEPTSTEEALAILDAVDGHRLAALWTLMLAAGLRSGEALGLRWQDVDLEKGQVSVRQALQRLNGQLTFVEPKSETSRRTIPLAPFAVAALRRHRAQQHRERLVAGNLWADSGLVFTTELGRPLDPSNVIHMFHRLLHNAGLRRLRNHDLRHACATLLLAKGLNMRVVMEILGHSQINLDDEHLCPCPPVPARGGGPGHGGAAGPGTVSGISARRSRPHQPAADRRALRAWPQHSSTRRGAHRLSDSPPVQWPWAAHVPRRLLRRRPPKLVSKLVSKPPTEPLDYPPGKRKRPDLGVNRAVSPVPPQGIEP